MSRAEEMREKADDAHYQDDHHASLREAIYKCTAALIETLEERLPDERERAENVRLREALEEIQRGEGGYSQDPLTHAGNCIESMKAIAADALLAARRESEGGE